MQGSFGSSGRMGGEMLRAAGRAVSAGIGSVKQSISTATPKRNGKFSLSSTSSSSSPLLPHISFPISPTLTVDGCDDDDDWQSVDGDDERECNVGFYKHSVFGPVPSIDEVEDAISAIHQVLATDQFSQTIEGSFSSAANKDESNQMKDPNELIYCVSSAKSESDWIEPAVQLYQPKALAFPRCNNVFDAFRLLQRNTSVQRMVTSLSSDRAVWDAVMNNAVVRELRDSFFDDLTTENDQKPSSMESRPEVVKKFLVRVLHNTKVKIMEFTDNIMKLLFQAPAKEKPFDGFEDTLKSSFMLSIVVLLVVVVIRSRKN